MTYEVTFTKTSKKQFEKLDKQLQERIVKVLERIRTRPKSFAKPLKGIDLWSVRIGKYRALIDIKEAEIIIHKIGHRKNIYQF